MKIKLFLMDVDGVLTDGGVYYTVDGEWAKRFYVHDGVGIEQLHKIGVRTGIVTSETSELVRKRAKRLSIHHLYMGKKMGQKLPTIARHCDKAGIALAEVAYMGDDINCYDLLKSVGYPACPANAQEIIKSIPKIHITSKSGGQGAIREWINYLFEQQSFVSAPLPEER